MPRRIEIELTSARPDGSWTWRVAGAKQPKGVLDGALLPSATKVGDILRADAEFELEGTTITAVVAPPEKRPPERLAILGDSRPFEGVTTSLVPKSPRRRDRPDGDRREGRPARADGPRPPARRPGATEGRPDRAGRTDRDTRPAGTGRPDREGRPASADRDNRPGADRRPERSTRPPAGREAGSDRRSDRPRPDERKSRPDDRRPKRLVAGNTHRNAVLETLPPEERAVAEQLLNGGVPALRRALQEQNTKAREDGRPEIKADALIELAEELLPRLKSAEWRDRAEAASKEGDQLSMRDLRSVVAGGDAAARDDDSRILAKTLRESLDRREAAEREAWIADMTTCLDEGKVTRALRVAGRPPDPRTRFPAELSTRLTEAASEALSPDTPPERWGQLLAALIESPVRRAVKPRGLPAEPGEALLAAARQASGRVPALAPLLGLTMPPPPGPPRGARRPPAPPARRPPPAPPAPAAAAPPAAVDTTGPDRASVSAETFSGPAEVVAPDDLGAAPVGTGPAAADTTAPDTTAPDTGSVSAETFSGPAQADTPDDLGAASVGAGPAAVEMLDEPSQPDPSQPEASQPEASQPEASQPEASQPEASQPEASQPEASQPEASQPEASPVGAPEARPGSDAELAPEAAVAPPTESAQHGAEPVSTPYGPEAEAPASQPVPGEPDGPVTGPAE